MIRRLQKLRLIHFIGIIYLVFTLPALAQMPADTAFNNVVTQSEDSLTSAKILIGDVSITGFKQTKPYIVQREVAFKIGESITRSSLAERMELSRQQLMNTSLFVDVEVKSEFLSKEVVLINIHVKERWYLFPLPYFKMVDRNFNTWWVVHKRSLERINYGLKFFHNNVSGRNDKLNIWLVSGYTQQVSLRYENPFLDTKLRHGMNVGFSFSRNREINYETSLNKQSFFKNESAFLIKSIHVDLSYSYRPAIKTRHNFRVSYSDMHIEDTVVKLNPTFFPSSKQRVRFPDVSYSIQYFNVDYIPYPLKGFSGDAYIYKRFGSTNNLWQVGAKGTYTKKVLPKSYIQFQGAGVLRMPFKQPYFNLRLLGTGDLYMRGLEYYVIDGVAGGLARATLIQQALNVKFRNPVKIKTLDKIPLKLYLKAYTDMGYSYHPNPGNSIFNNKLLKTWGIGVDILTVYDVVLKLEYSFNQIGDKGLFIHSKSDF